MKIKQGYKQTDIGIIPEDWEVKTLSKIATFENGKAHEQFIDDSGNWVVVNSKFISTEGQIAKFSNVGISPLKVGNIAIVMSDIPNGKALAKCFLVKKNDRYTLNQRIGAIIANENIDNDFLYYKLNRNEYFLSFDSGSGQTNLRKNEIVECPLAFPLTKQEQQAIAQTLSNIDSLIEALNKKIAKKRAIKEGAMQQLLTGKKRLAGFSEDWIEKKFEQIVDKQIKKGQMLTASEYIEGNIPVIAGGKTPAGYHAYANREKNTITISASGANAGFVAFHCNPIFATDCSTISESNKFDIKYIYYLLCLNQDIIYKAQIGGAQPHIHAKDIYPLEVFYTTDIKEQQSIAQILTDMDNEIELLEKERQKYTVLKQGAMQKLLTGQIRLIAVNQTQSAEMPPKKANVHFKRSVWAAEIADRLCDEPTFGHVKMEKLIFLTEHICGVDIGSNYHRNVAGPYDNRAIRSIDSQLKKQNWFEVVRRDMGYRYLPLSKRGGHKDYFNKYYSDVESVFEKVINTFRTWNTERCEIVATLYSAWKDLVDAKQPYTDNDIINEVLNNWNDSKKRIPEERWQKALNWMRENGFVPIEI